MKKRVLLYDSEISELSKIHLDLILNGYEVEVTDSFDEILPRMKRFGPDVVVLNKQVFEYNCNDVCATIKNKFNVPVILLGHEPPSLGTCMPITFIQKPVKKAELLQAINHLTLAVSKSCC